MEEEGGGEKGVRIKWKERKETEGSESRIGEGGREEETTKRKRDEGDGRW